MTDCGLCSLPSLLFCYNTSLKNLHLSGNKLTNSDLEAAFENVDSLRQLWLNDNRLDSLRGLSNLVNLKSLWLCRNKIERIGENGNFLECKLTRMLYCTAQQPPTSNLLRSLLPPRAPPRPRLGDHISKLPELTDLNLADNRIGCFKELLPLSNITTLQNLFLNDPHFGSNPVCSLCNYQTYALYHLSQITRLDAELITDEAKSLAQSIYMKKKMYYNMRMKTLKRNATNVMREAEEIFKQKLSSLNVTLNMLLKKKKDVEGFLEMNRYSVMEGEDSGEEMGGSQP
jgi:hypothetical protein